MNLPGLREEAETWPVGIGDEAFIEAYRYNWDSWRTAAEDVVRLRRAPLTVRLGLEAAHQPVIAGTLLVSSRSLVEGRGL
jgi:hypothetical protein